MAETGSADAPKGGGDSKNFGFLTHKIGPLPVWAYGAIAVGIYYWYTHYGPGAKKSQQNQGQNKGSSQKVIRSGGPTTTVTHITHEHQRPQHSRNGHHG